MIEDDERTRLRDELHELQVMMEAVLQNSPDYIFTVNPNLMMMYFNRQLPGAISRQAFAMTITDILPQEYRASINEAVEEVFKTGESKGIGLDLEGGDGQISYTARIAPVKDGNTTVAAIIVFSDITKLKGLVEENNSMKGLAADEKKLKTIEQEKTAISMQARQLTDENAKVKAQASETERQLKAALDECRQAKGQSSSAASENAKLRSVEQENAGLKSQVRQLSDENSRLAKVEQELEKAKARSEESERQLREAQEEGKTLKARVSEISDKTRIKQIEQDNASLRAQVAQLSKERNDSKKVMEEENSKLRSQLTKVMEDVNAEKARYERAKKSEENLMDSIQKMKKQSDDLAAQIGRIKQDDDVEIKGELELLQNMHSIVHKRMKDIVDHHDLRDKPAMESEGKEEKPKSGKFFFNR